MKNSIRIITNKSKARILYFFKNEFGEWIDVPITSELSRNKFTYSRFTKERANEIVKVINQKYNRGHGVDIFFTGEPDEFEYLKLAVKNCSGSGISCINYINKIMVLGKKSSGKTTLIEAIEEYKGVEFKKEECSGYTKYIEKSNKKKIGIWYEIEGLDISKESIEKAKETMNALAKENISTFLYCFIANEKNFIYDLRSKHRDITVLAVITQDIDNKNDEYFEKTLKDIYVMPTLAKDRELRTGDEIKAYGIDNLLSHLPGGK